MSPKPRRLSHAPCGERFSDILPDDIIVEILLRLPFSSVFAFRSVSTAWLSLTTSRYFLQRWELHHAPFHLDPPLAILLQSSYTFDERPFFLLSGVPQVKLSGFSFDFLSEFRLNGNDPITVLGSCEDLLLCCNRERFQRDYFIVNPITRQWAVLPPILLLHEYVLTGFVCDPTSIAEARKGGELRYRVVRILVFQRSKTEFNVEIFSSEDRQWNEYVMTLAEGLTTASCINTAVACNGILYWRFHNDGIKVMGLDPFNPKKKGINIIQNAPGFDADLIDHVFGSCRGKLRMSELAWSEDRYDNELDFRMNIWELEYGEGKWKLVQEIRWQEILVSNSSIIHLYPWVAAISTTCWIFAFHPSDKEIIYLYCYGHQISNVISCNLKKMSLEIVSDYDFSLLPTSHLEFFPFLMPWWPTPVPALPKLCI